MADDTTQPPNRSSTSAEHITDVSSFDRLIENEERVLVDFYADWCGPCQLMAPTVDELATETDAAVVKIDVEAVPEVAARYDVNSVPTFLAFGDGAVNDRLIGMQDKSKLAQTID